MRVLVYDHKISDLANIDYYISANYKDERRLKDENYKYINELSGTLSLFEQATEELYKFSNNSFLNKSIKEIISFQGISLWWFYEIAIRMKYIQYIKYREMLNNFFEQSKITYILCNINDSIFLSAARDCCVEMGIPFEVIPAKKNMVGLINPYLNYTQYGLNFVLDATISRFYSRRIRAQIVIASYTNYWTRFNITKEIPKDGIFNDVQKELEEHGIKYVGLEYNNESLWNYIKTRFNKRKYATGKWIPLNAFVTRKTLTDSIKIYKNVCSDISRISFDNNKDKFILNLLKDHLKTSFFLISDILSTNNALSLIRPKVLLTSCEYCKMGRAATIIGNKAGISTVALQHGIITSVHWGYMFSKSEETSFNDSSNSRPLPRYTLLYGIGYQELLLKNSNYPPRSLIITGQPRYDHLYNAARSMDKGRFMEEQRIKLPLIVWTSQGDFPELETNKNINCFLHLLDSIPEITLFIKPHPNEKDLSIYKPLTKRQNVILSGDIDLYKLLNVCSMMITKNSTTAMEAAALDKPIIVLNLSGEPDVVDYVKEGIAFGVYREEDMLPRVEMLLKDDSELRNGRMNYIKKYLYKIDGNSSERVTEFLGTILR